MAKIFFQLSLSVLLMLFDELKSFNKALETNKIFNKKCF